jgi:hypothetical protein
LWEHLGSSILDVNGDSAAASRSTEDFCTYCRMWDVRDAYFHVKCRWATPSEFHSKVFPDNSVCVVSLHSSVSLNSPEEPISRSLASS